MHQYKLAIGGAAPPKEKAAPVTHRTPQNRQHDLATKASDVKAPSGKLLFRALVYEATFGDPQEAAELLERWRGTQ